MVSTTKESVEEQEIAGNRDGDSKDRSRKTTEMVIKREQKSGHESRTIELVIIYV